MQRDVPKKSAVKVITEIILAVALFALFLGVPAISGWNMQDILRNGHSYEYYDAAQVSTEYQPERIATYLEQGYVRTLHLLFLFLGNNVEWAACFQYILWGVVVLLAYLGARRVLGGIAGLLVLLAGVCASWFQGEILCTLSPFVLPALFGALVFCVLVYAIAGRLDIHTASLQNPEEQEEPMNENMEKIEEVNRIPNVLPEPKKHVRREPVDYALEVPPELLFFDIEVSDGDDFDR